MDEVKITLNNISEKLKNYHYINYGGCCLYAYLIASQLDKRNIPYKVIIEEPYHRASAYYKQAKNLRKHLDIYHVLLKINNKYYYDSNGSTKERYGTKKVYLKLNSQDILNLYANGDWNSLFKMRTSKSSIKKIKQIIKEEFNEYDKRVKNSM